MLENITNLEMIVISAVLYLIGSIPFAIISSKIFNFKKALYMPLIGLQIYNNKSNLQTSN